MRKTFKLTQDLLPGQEESLINKILSRRRFLGFTTLTASIVILLRKVLTGCIKENDEKDNAIDSFKENFMDKSDFGPIPYPAPDCLRNAVIVEVPTRGLNVSDNNNPGNWRRPYGDTIYKSINAKLDYLKDMGINVLCLYSVYNCTPATNLYTLRYTEQNPDMGTLDDVKELTREAQNSN